VLGALRAMDELFEERLPEPGAWADVCVGRLPRVQAGYQPHPAFWGDGPVCSLWPASVGLGWDGVFGIGRRGPLRHARRRLGIDWGNCRLRLRSLGVKTLMREFYLSRWFWGVVEDVVVSMFHHEREGEGAGMQLHADTSRHAHVQM